MEGSAKIGACAACEFWQVEAPPGWQSSYTGEKPDLYDWRLHARENWEKGKIVNWRALAGYCRFYPNPMSCKGDHGCGHFTSAMFNHPSTELRQFFEREIPDVLQREVTELKRQLKRCREISAGRLKRIKAK